MAMRNSSESYGAITKGLHWLIFLCVLIQIIIGFFNDSLSVFVNRGELIMIHKSIGLTLVPLSILFILWGMFSRKPDWPEGMAEWEKTAARIAHSLLYLLVFAMAASGWVMSTAAGYIPSWFGLFSVAAPWVPKSKALSSEFLFVHSVCAWSLVVLGCIHILAALKHQFLEKDHILSRML